MKIFLLVEDRLYCNVISLYIFVDFAFKKKKKEKKMNKLISIKSAELTI